MILRLSLSIAILVIVPACARIQTTAKPAGRFTSNRLAPDAVVLDVAFVRLPASDAKVYPATWEAADEQAIPAEIRRALMANGFRVGVLGQKLPIELENALEAATGSQDKFSEQAALDLESGASRQHLPVRAGHRSIVKASPVYPTLAVLLSDDGLVRGHQLTEARCNLTLKAYPLGDGRVKLCLLPEIEHGQTKTRWVGSEGMMMQQTGQERLTLDRLQMEATLNMGQCLVLSTTPEAKGLGQHYFAQTTSGGIERRLLLIRFTQTQFDDLFAPEQTSAPLATPVD